MRWWRDLSIIKKLYAVVGLMALLIAVELLTLSYAMKTLSAVRAFVEGEGLWSKAQKDAVLNLHQYGSTYDEVYFKSFLENLRVPLGDRQARLAMERQPIDVEAVFEGFRQGQIHNDDIPKLIYMITKLHDFPYVRDALVIWREGDRLLDDLIDTGNSLRQAVTASKRNLAEIDEILDDVDALNNRLTQVEKEFSATLGEGSRWIEYVLMVALLCAVLTVECTGLYLTYRFSRHLGSSLREIKDFSQEVGEGRFFRRMQVRSNDELGQLTKGLNRMTEQLENSVGKREQAESASHVKSLFLANMSHEVRTPLGVILGLIEILKDPNLSAEDREKYIGVIELTGQNLRQIINDILDISKVEAGHLEIQKTRFPLNDFMEELRLPLLHLAERGKNNLFFQPIGHLPEMIVTDRARLRQILTNLVGNALKFTHEGEVAVSYWASSNRIHFRIKDTGIGIQAQERERLFKPFSQLDHSSTRKYGGTGLGLLLSKRFAQSLGGDIHLESSEPGVGSVFSLDLPLSAGLSVVSARKQEEKEDDFEKLRGKKVLVVEDSPENQMLIQLFLNRKEMSVDCADNGREGIEKALKNTYDLVLMDMQMPIVDGYTATEELRKKGYKVPILALTAHAMKEDRERCLRVGCNDYLTKPIDSQVLYRTLFSHIA